VFTAAHLLFHLSLITDLHVLMTVLWYLQEISFFTISKKGKSKFAHLFLNWVPRLERVLGEFRYSSTHS